MADRKQLPDLPEATDVSPDDLFLKRDTGETTDQHAGAQLVADKLLGMGQVESSTGQQTVGEALDQRVIYVDTVADLQALDTSGLVEGQQASVGQAGMFVWSGSEWLPKNSETITVRIPSDYPTLQEAIDTLSNFKPTQGVVIDLLIESGHVINYQTVVKNSFCGHFQISAEDDEVKVDRSAITQTFSTSAAGSRTPVICGVGSYMPTLNCVLDMDAEEGDDVIDAYIAIKGSVGKVSTGCGVVNNHGVGIGAYDSSSIDATSTKSIGVGQSWVSGSGYACWNGSTLTAASANASDNFYGLVCSTSSSVRARNITAENCFRHALRADECGTVECFNANLKNASSAGINCWRGSTIHAEEADVSGAGNNGIVCWNASRVVARGITANGCETRGVYVVDSSHVDLSLSSSGKSPEINNCKGDAVYVRRGSSLSGAGLRVLDFEGEHCIRLDRGSLCEIRGGEFDGDNLKFYIEPSSKLILSILSIDSGVTEPSLDLFFVEGGHLELMEVTASASNGRHGVRATGSARVHLSDSQISMTNPSGNSIDMRGGCEGSFSSVVARNSDQNSFNIESSFVRIVNCEVDQIRQARGSVVSVWGLTGNPTATAQRNTFDGTAGILIGEAI